MHPVSAVSRFIEKPPNFLSPLLLQQEGAQCSGRYLSDMPETAAEIPFNMLLKLGTMLFGRARTSNNIQSREHCLGGARL